ncbi:hypothetical protein ERD78_07080 [Allopusillimonas soli]|uniref:AzlD domain-containing protein n=1 Tax=Allopusillimonas soli TaxID=659016 RepID=A0A853F9M1_9BURK|nr:AzlD domain-containing protein [Allopusillimonas soli]NYT36629.1 AzlD domain-containing protein [Allopusillimonas soli]TEA75115.1 hypothetical protein ERD78_07080 [Allopusillimonas soli]
MDMTTVGWVIALSGLGTLLVRLLPMIWHDRSQGAVKGTGTLRRALDAIGPSAIVALLVVSVWSLVDAQAFAGSVLPVLAGMAGVVLGRLLLGGIAWATLAGVLAYGLAIWLSGG